MNRHVVGRAADLGDGERLIVEVAGRSIGIFRVDGRLYGLRNRCPHAGGELCRGRLLGRLSSRAPGHYEHDLRRPLVRCPWHGWEFDLQTGASVVDARALRVRPYEVQEVPGATLDEGRYRAETVEVSIDDEYLVVTLGGSGG
jgi:3-phenylpropionate/trans-cinnamate dioxygenase ferredoxin subunit